MNRQLFLIALLFSSLVLQPGSGYAQLINLQKAGMQFTLPNNKWKVFLEKQAQTAALSIYVPERESGNKPPRISITVITEDLTGSRDIDTYTAEKIKILQLKTGKQFSSTDPNAKLSFANAIGYKARYVNAMNPDYLYCVILINGKTGVTILCEAPPEQFGKYDAEFSGILRSFRNVSSENAATEIPNPKTILPEKSSGNSCSYFPVMNGMKFTYQRKDRTGEHAIVESYAVVKDKTLKSGKIIKGYNISTTVANRNNTVIYYYCDEGSVKMYSEMPSYTTYIKEYVEDYSVLPSDYNKPIYKKTPVWETEKYGSGKYLHFTELKAGGIGTEWTDIQVVNDNPVTITSKIVETGLTLTVRGKNYSPVIHVERTVSIEFQGETQELNSQDIYYAKGVGKIKVVEEGSDILMGNYTTTQELVSHNLPAQTYDDSKGKNNPGEAYKNGTPEENKTLNAAKALLKGKTDESLVGSWKFFKKYFPPAGSPYTMTLIYRFNADGTYGYYTDALEPQNLKIKGVWKMNKDTMELMPDNDPQIKKLFIQKLNNAYTGKPSIAVAWSATDMREFESMDNKNPWKGIPAFGKNMEPEKKVEEKLEGDIDSDIIGLWKMELRDGNSSLQFEIYQFNIDGTGEVTQVYRRSGNTRRTKFEWRVKDNILWKRTDCGDKEKCIQHNEPLKKINSGNKRAIKIEYGLYQNMSQ